MIYVENYIRSACATVLVYNAAIVFGSKKFGGMAGKITEKAILRDVSLKNETFHQYFNNATV